MSDNGSGIGNLPGDISEAMVKPVVDEVGKDIEAVVQSVTGSQKPPPTPEEQAKKKEEEEKKRQRALYVIEWNKNLDAAQAKVRADQTQKIQQQNQQNQQKTEDKKFETLQATRQQQADDLAQAQRKTEIRKGVGG